VCSTAKDQATTAPRIKPQKSTFANPDFILLLLLASGLSADWSPNKGLTPTDWTSCRTSQSTAATSTRIAYLCLLCFLLLLEGLCSCCCSQCIHLGSVVSLLLSSDHLRLPAKHSKCHPFIRTICMLGTAAICLSTMPLCIEFFILPRAPVTCCLAFSACDL